MHFCKVMHVTMARYNLKVKVVPLPLAPAVDSFLAITARFFQLKLSSGCNIGGIQLSPPARVKHVAEKSWLKESQHPLPPLDFRIWESPAGPGSGRAIALASPLHLPTLVVPRT